MIRSLVTTGEVPCSEKNSENLKLRRNLAPNDLEQAIDAGCLLWIDIVDPEPDEISWLTQLFNLNVAVVQDLRRDDRRPALLVYPEYLFLSLFEPYISRSHILGREVHCLILDRCFVTVRGADAVSVDEAYTRVAQNPNAWQSGIAYCFYLTAQHITDAYYPLLDRASSQLNAVEERLLNGANDPQARKSIYRIKQQLIKMREMIAPQREVFSNVIGEKRLSENENTRDLFRHLYKRLLRVYDVIDSQRDLSSNVLDMMQNQESRKLVEAVNRLTIFSMIFLPLTFFAALFELDFATTTEPFVLPVPGYVLFLIVVGAMISSASFMLLLFKRRGWI